MSRIGRLPISVPAGVEVSVDGSAVSVKGPKGTLSRTISEPLSVTRQEDGSILVTRPDDERESRSLHGLSRTLINNMVVGVTEGFKKNLEIVGVGYRAEMSKVGSLDVLEAIGSIDVPVTIINGRRDEFRIHERRFLAANDAARLVVLDDAGHISNLNRPKRFTKELRAAFERAERQRLVVA